MITIINYGLGNLGSVHNMLKWIGAESIITSDPSVIKSATKLLLPGVGAFDSAVTEIKKRGLWEILDEIVKVKKIPILGICLGMQLLTECSQEGQHKGFGWIPGETIHFEFPRNLFKIPHMGWNQVSICKQNPLLAELPIESKFYFVHSYYVKVANESHSLLKAKYGDIEFDAAIHHDNVWGTQFHPEKSHKYGMIILKNFAKLECLPRV